MWADLLLGKVPDIKVPEGRKHVLQDDAEELESDADLALFNMERRYGKLTVLRVADFARGIRWWCLCECGKTKVIVGSELKAGKHKTCGCGQYLMRFVKSGYAKFGQPCACGCGRLTERYKVVKGYRKACYMKAKRAVEDSSPRGKRNAA